MPAEALQVVTGFYEALAARDSDALLDTLAPHVRVHISEGMPNGLGRTYEGPQAMLRDCWGPINTLVDVEAVPNQFLSVDADRMVVIGRYLGTARGSGKQLSAAFAHIFRVDGDRISELVQITDTARWRDALDQ